MKRNSRIPEWMRERREKTPSSYSSNLSASLSLPSFHFSLRWDNGTTVARRDSAGLILDRFRSYSIHSYCPQSTLRVVSFTSTYTLYAWVSVNWQVRARWYADTRARARAKKPGPPEAEDQIIIIIITICVPATSESLKVGSFARSKEPMSHSLSRIEKASPMASPLSE